VSSSGHRKRRLNPRRGKYGWRALAAAAGLWILSVMTSRVGLGSALILPRLGISVGLRFTAIIAVLGIIAVAAAWALLLPLRRPDQMRDWSIALLLIVFLMTDLYLLSWTGLF